MKYRNALPQLSRPFITDGGLETTLVFLDGIDLPEFAAIDLMKTREGRQRIDSYFRDYIAVARRHGVGFILESPTWRGSADYADALRITPTEMDRLNAESIAMLLSLRDEHETDDTPIVVSGCVGPRHDGYAPETIMPADTAQAYHQRQVEVLADAGVDCISAITMTYTDEAIGIARAASSAGVPSVISFTVETDGRLVTGATIAEAITRVDEATGGAPAYYMINCAHPTHFESSIEAGQPWTERIRGIRANASKCSHAELDASETLDIGDPLELGSDYVRLSQVMPRLTVLGGCCGTDLRHIGAIAEARFAA